MADTTALIEEPQDPNYGAVEESRSVYSEETKQEPRGFMRRFWWLCLLGIGAMIVADLTFLPRTSPNRDFRRWHGLKLTKADVERLYISLLRPGRNGSDGYTTEDHIYMYLQNLSDINSRVPMGIAGSETPELTQYLTKQMSGKHFDVRVYEYDLPLNLRTPLSLNISLYDAKNSRKLYTTPLFELQTPAFFTFSSTGTLRKNYVNANSGTPDDYALLAENKILVAGKFVLFSHNLQSALSLTSKILLAEKLDCAGVIVYGDVLSPRVISRAFVPWDVPPEAFRMPVSFAQIEPVLKTLVPSKDAFQHWQYGPVSDDDLKLELACSALVNPLRAVNVVSTMRSALHDGVIIVGAARDSLTSSNPMSGHAIMLQIMRSFEELVELGWLPLRTIKFVSWDASRSNALGSAAAINDPSFLGPNTPVLAYINLDGDTVSGSQFSVDSHPALNHILRHAAQYVASPGVEKGKSSLNFEGSLKNSTLLDFWNLQSNATINNRLGYDLAGKDSALFQLFRQANTVNIQFSNDHSRDKKYVPESNMYDLTWLENQDKGFVLHGTLSRYIGLLLISLGETEVIDQRMSSYFRSLTEAYSAIYSDFKDVLSKWNDIEVSGHLNEVAPESALFEDAKRLLQNAPSVELLVTFKNTLITFDSLLNDLVNKSTEFDKQSKELANLWTTDYPWFKLPKKLVIYLKFKLLNRMLLQFDQNMSKNTKPWQPQQSKPHHAVYEIPNGLLPISDLLKRGAFASLYEAYDAKSLKEVMLVMADKYEKLKGAYLILG